MSGADEAVEAEADALAEREVVERGGFDRLAYAEAREAHEDVEKAEEAFAAKGHDGGSVVGDLHAALYKAEPQVREDSTAPHRALVEEAMKTSEYHSLREHTTLDSVASALAAGYFATALAEKADPAAPEGGDLTLGNDPGDLGHLRRAARQAMKHAAQQTTEALDAAAALGWGRSEDGGGNGRSDLATVKKAASAVRRSAKLKAILDIAGRMRALALRRHETRFTHGPDEVVGVEVGGDISRALPSELALLRHPKLRRELLQRLLERKILQYEMRSTEPEAKGPIVCAIDCSGSMSGAREWWAKGLALGLLSIALKEKRPFAIVLFSDRVTVEDFGGKVPTIERLTQALEAFDGAGTNFEGALDASLGVCERPGALDKADIVFITDGAASVEDGWRDAWLARKRAKGARMWGLTIGTSARTLDQLADGVAHVADLRDDAEAVDLAFGF